MGYQNFRMILLASSALVPLGVAGALANPQGAQVVGGSATVQGQGTQTVTVTQSSDRAIINWNTFNIGAGELTRFVQPSASSIALNRVTGGLGPSQLYGSLTANGRIFLVNPDGILIGPGAKIDTAGFLATTNGIKNDDFMAGRYNFQSPGRPDASVVNQGSITAQSGGFAALVAPGVRNSGTITANLGTIGLASGNGFSLDLYGDRLIKLNVSDSVAATVKDVATGEALSSLVKNDGKLKANGGRVELTAVAARQVVDSVINTSGIIEAKTIGQRNGMIVLGATTAANKPSGAPVQNVKVSGKLLASGRKQDSKGGTIHIAGEAITLAGATLDASGVSGGGAIKVGGDAHGAGPWPNATTLQVSADTSLRADALQQGNGGSIVLWSNAYTNFAGSISAKGGVSGGDGGNAEVSGKETLSYAGFANLTAPNGKAGTLLLDPNDYVIDATAANTLVANLAGGNVTIQTTASGSGGNGDITVSAPVNWGNANALTLSAYRNIAVNANITNSASAAVTLRADNTGTGTGTVSFGGAQISTAGAVSIFYNPSVNPAGSVVNGTSYVSQTENYASNIAGGGALTQYMLVNTVYDLQNINNSLSDNYALGKDIIASGTSSWNGGAGFIPISLTGPFVGQFDGQQHAIKNLTENVSSGFSGLFGYVGAAGIVKDINLENASIQSSVSAPVGGLVGRNDGIIRTSHVTGSISAPDTIQGVGGLVGDNRGQVINSSVDATVVGILAGGLVGYNRATVLNSSSAGSVSCVPSKCHSVGGLVGASEVDVFVLAVAPLIYRSYSTASVTVFDANANGGGLVGGNSGGGGFGAFPSFTGTITQSYSTGTVTGPGANLGGLVGLNFYLGSIDQSYSTSRVVGGASANVGGLVGFNSGAEITKSYAAGILTSGAGSNVGGFIGSVTVGLSANAFQSSYWDQQASGQLISVGNNSAGASLVGISGLSTNGLKSALPSGFDPAVWAISASVNAGYPYLIANAPIVAATPGSGGSSIVDPAIAGMVAQLLNQKPGVLSVGINTGTNESTPSSAPSKASIWQAIPTANAYAISAVKSDERIKAALTDLQIEALSLFLSGGSSYVTQRVGDIYGLWVLFNSSQPAKDYVDAVLNKAFDLGTSARTVPLEGTSAKIISYAIQTYEAAFIDSMFKTLSGR